MKKFIVSCTFFGLLMASICFASQQNIVTVINDTGQPIEIENFYVDWNQENPYERAPGHQFLPGQPNQITFLIPKSSVKFMVRYANALDPVNGRPIPGGDNGAFMNCIGDYGKTLTLYDIKIGRPKGTFACRVT